MSATELGSIIVDLATIVALFYLVIITICRLNLASNVTSPSLRISYILMGSGAFAVLYSGQYDWKICLFSVGISACLQTDRRRSRAVMDSFWRQFRKRESKLK